ncbi:MAG TPA: TetR/AcrR family transcriptional regulator [Gemmatimonadales bacterium]|nr:TetR/AcrR family transcriptional regulator [Gemmatimonadales bacterium]
MPQPSRRSRSPRTPRTPRWRRRPEARPEEILDAALEVFGAEGFARARLDDVARRAGVSKGTLYRYFDSKETLFREMIRAKVVAAIAETEGIIEQHRGPWRDLLVAIVRRLYHILRHDGLSRISRLVGSELASFPELGHYYYEEAIVRARRMLDLVFAGGIASGEFREVAHGYASRALPELLIHTTQTQVFFQRFDPDALSDDTVVEGLLDFVLGGVLARPADAS